MRELSLCRNNKDSLAQPQVILVVPGGALGTLARRSAEKDTRRRVTGGLPLLLSSTATAWSVQNAAAEGAVTLRLSQTNGA